MSVERVTAWMGSLQAFPAPREVEVVSLPYVDPPLWVAKAWVGLQLPVASGVQEFETRMLTKAPNTKWRWYMAKLLRRTATVRGYLVNVKHAVDILSETNPEAARWWRENQPGLMDGKSCIVFRERACRPARLAVPPSANDPD